MTRLPLILDPDRYLDGPLAPGQSVKAFAYDTWQSGTNDADEDGRGAAGPHRGHGEVLASLGLIYLRHGDPARAMVLGLAAMSMGDLSPKTILMIGEAMLLAGDPQQASAVLSRFDRDDGLATPPSQAERAARHYIAARIHDRLGETERARAELKQARDIVPEKPVEDRI
ncbi:tetratricopeptide repeat protein [Paracoccus alkanivorans]|uniref:Tetratricopeptide repeat protein n=1 Tax=Paracoccus alkanivorans TaxID=2116655 RepID=A0A3M0MCJ4_9RHOB|nr:hypothetical protein [Paracoccus alkanivorans]RMC34923.1 hypothetical protein C9E81_12605 [Paracoccus alkanivorans]